MATRSMWEGRGTTEPKSNEAGDIDYPLTSSSQGLPTQFDTLPRILTVEEMAAFLGIGRSLAYSLVKRGEIPSVRLGRLYRIPRDTLMDWLERESAASAGTQAAGAEDGMGLFEGWRTRHVR
jgi:excisionase family DNA binding protein